MAYKNIFLVCSIKLRTISNVLIIVCIKLSSFTLFFYLRIKSSLSDSNFIIFYSPIEIIVCGFYFDFIYDIDFRFFGAIFPIYFQNNIENKTY
jgi:hypothetical protein